MGNTPNIRFKGFTDDWEQRKLRDDLVSIHTGTNLLGSITNTGMPLIKMGNIQRGYFDTLKVEFLAENEQPDKADIANYGDFFFNTRNTLELVGKGATWMKNSGEYAFNSNIARFELRNLDTIFFNYLYNTDYMTKQIHARAMGTTSVAAIYPRTLDSVEYSAPCMKEQQKIGAYFKQLDHLITLHQRKCDETKKLKKFMLQKMFPKKDAKKPEIRFAGFTDDWEQRKVSDVAKIIAGGTPSTKENSYWEPKEIPWLSSGEVHKKYITFTDDMISQIGMNNSSAKMVAKDSVLIALAGQGKTRGTVAINRIPLTTNQSIAAMTFNENFIPEFVFYNLENRYDELRRMSSGDGSRGGLNKQLVGDIEIPYTEKKEQERIGSFFESLDRIIALHQRKCDELKEFKKYMLQNMFPQKG